MRLVIIAASLALVGLPSPSSGQVKDTSVAEVICRDLGFEPGSPLFGGCVLNRMAKLDASSNTVPTTSRLQAPQSSDPYAGLDNDFARAELAYRRGDYAGAYDYMIKAARAGDNRAYVPVAKYYINGTGVSADATKAMFWLKKAEQRRDPEAYPLLAQAYLNGNGVRQDVQKAYDLIEAARRARGTRQSQEIERIVKYRVGEDTFTCMRYGMAYGTPQNGQCRLQLEQAKQQARIAQQQLAFEQRRYQQELAAYQAQVAAAEQARKKEEERRALGNFFRGMANSQGCRTSAECFLRGAAGGAGVALPPIPPPPSPPTIDSSRSARSQTIFLPNGRAVTCNTVGPTTINCQ